MNQKTNVGPKIFGATKVTLPGEIKGLSEWLVLVNSVEGVDNHLLHLVTVPGEGVVRI